MKAGYSEREPYITKDGSLIRELLHPRHSGISMLQSLAQATVAAGRETELHRHRMSEEIYHFTQEYGIVTLGEKVLKVEKGDSILISPGVWHKVKNTGRKDLVFLCCCSPAYRHEDTELSAETVSASK
ncbi:cupin domain-containing protein [Thiovibrio sp. JS02]